MFLSLLMALAFGAACSERPDVPQKPPPPPVEFLGQWGTAGNGPGQFDEPSRMTVDALGNVYVADTGSGFLHKFAPDGMPLLSFQDPAFRHPVDIAMDRGSAIYAADAARSRIVIFSPDGESFRQFRCRHRGALHTPLGIAVDDDGIIFLAEPGFHQVQKYSPRGRLLKAWSVYGGQSRELGDPARIRIGRDASLYVAETQEHCIQKFTREGNFISFFCPEELGPFAVSEKYLLVAEPDRNKLEVWTLAGERKLTLDLAGSGPSDAVTPSDIALSPRGELLLLDAPKHRVVRYRLNF